MVDAKSPVHLPYVFILCLSANLFTLRASRWEMHSQAKRTFISHLLLTSFFPHMKKFLDVKMNAESTCKTGLNTTRCIITPWKSHQLLLYMHSHSKKLDRYLRKSKPPSSFCLRSIYIISPPVVNWKSNNLTKCNATAYNKSSTSWTCKHLLIH